MPTIPGPQLAMRDRREDLLQEASSLTPGQQSFEWLLHARAATPNQTDLVAISFAATGTLGFERLRVADLQVDQTAAPSTPPSGPTREHPALLADLHPGEDLSLLPPMPERDSPLTAAIHPATVGREEAMPERFTPGGRGSSPEPDSSWHATYKPMALPVATSNSESRPVVAEHAPTPDAAAPATTVGPPPPSAPSQVSIMLQSAEGVVRAYATLPAWAGEDIAELRVRARYLLSSYNWADGALHIRQPGSMDPEIATKERIHGR